MKFTNIKSVGEVIDVPMEGQFGLWDIRLYCKIGGGQAYSKVRDHLYILPLIFSIQNTIKQEIKR
jgi:hypothetical protein